MIDLRFTRDIADLRRLAEEWKLRAEEVLKPLEGIARQLNYLAEQREVLLGKIVAVDQRLAELADEVTELASTERSDRAAIERLGEALEGQARPGNDRSSVWQLGERLTAIVGDFGQVRGGERSLREDIDNLLQRVDRAEEDRRQLMTLSRARPPRSEWWTVRLKSDWMPCRPGSTPKPQPSSSGLSCGIEWRSTTCVARSRSFFSSTESSTRACPSTRFHWDNHLEPISSLNDPIDVEIDDSVAEDKPIYPRLSWFTAVVVVSLIALWLRLYQLQIAQGGDYRDQADNNQFREVTIPAPRGVIYDRNQVVLARNRPSYTIGIVEADFPEPSQRATILLRLAGILGVPPGQLESAGNHTALSQFAFVPLASNVPENVAFTIEERHLEFPGVHVQLQPIRDYTLGSITAPILGYVGRISDAQYLDCRMTRSTVQSERRSRPKWNRADLRGPAT